MKDCWLYFPNKINPLFKPKAHVTDTGGNCNKINKKINETRYFGSNLPFEGYNQQQAPYNAPEGTLFKRSLSEMFKI